MDVEAAIRNLISLGYSREEAEKRVGRLNPHYHHPFNDAQRALTPYSLTEGIRIQPQQELEETINPLQGLLLLILAWKFKEPLEDMLKGLFRGLREGVEGIVKVMDAKKRLQELLRQDSYILQWLDVLTHSIVILIIGRQRRGKSALLYRLAEVAHVFMPERPACILRFPRENTHLLPSWIKPLEEFEKAPLGSILLVDEAHLSYHSRRSLERASIDMAQLLSTAGQKGQVVIFVSQTSAQLDKEVLRHANTIIFKEPGLIQSKLERPDLSKLFNEAGKAFSQIQGDKRPWSYVYCPDADICGLIKNQLASFWCEGLSHAFAGFRPMAPLPLAGKPEVLAVEAKERPVPLLVPRKKAEAVPPLPTSDLPSGADSGAPPSQAPREKRGARKRPALAVKIQQLLRKGHSYSEIASKLGRSKTAVAYYIKRYNL